MQYVSSFKISTSTNGQDWVECAETFEGTDISSEKTLEQPVLSARFVRFLPLGYTGPAPALRVEVRGIYKDEQGGIKSPRSGAADDALLGSDFLSTVKEMISVMTSALQALQLKTDIAEKADRRRMQRRRDNLEGEKEELETRLKFTEEEKAGLAAQVADLMEKLNTFQFDSVKLQVRRSEACSNKLQRCIFLTPSMPSSPLIDLLRLSLQAQKEMDDVTISRFKESVVAAEKIAEEKAEMLKSIESKVEGIEVEVNDVKGQLEVVTDERDIAREKEEQLFEKVSSSESRRTSQRGAKGRVKMWCYEFLLTCLIQPPILAPLVAASRYRGGASGYPRKLCIHDRQKQRLPGRDNGATRAGR